MLEVCIDSLESAVNAIHGGVDELEVCSSLNEGGLTPSAGLVKEVIQMVNNFAAKKLIYKSCSKCNCTDLLKAPNLSRPKVNVMLRCRGGSDFCYTKEEVDTMITDMHIFRLMGVDRFVFGALTNRQDIDEATCRRIIEQAHPIPVTFHRAFDVCNNPDTGIVKIIRLGFNRLLTSGQKATAGEAEAIKLIHFLHSRYGNLIQIMPGSGISVTNVTTYVNIGCKIVHSSCKTVRPLPKVEHNICLGMSYPEFVYVTDENIVRRVKEMITVTASKS